jgi:transketolase
MTYKQQIEETLFKIKHDKASQVPSVISVLQKNKQVASLRVITKKMLEDDKVIGLLAKWRSENQDAFPSQFTVTKEGTKKWSKSQLLDLPDRILFLLETNEGKPFAHMGLFRFDYKSKTCEIDNIVRGENVLSGIMTDALQTLITWTFVNLKISTLTLHVFSDNERAIRLYKRCGFIESHKIPLKKISEPGIIKFVEITGTKETPDRYYLVMKLDNTDIIESVKKKSSSTYSTLEAKAKDIRRKVFTMIVNGTSSHIGSSYSVVELLVYLYEKVLRIDPKKPNDPNRDRFVLSKGWAISALYAMLADKGFFSKKLLDEYCKDGSIMIGGSTRNGLPGVEATTTSMGHGLPLGVGMALAGKLQKRSYRVVVIMGDGESDEGSTWEAIMQAAHNKLDNLLVIVDFNKWQSFGRPSEILNLEPYRAKWEAFNWEVKEIDGHDFSDMEKVFKKLPFVKGKPSVIIAHTVKGKGVSILEDRNEWHYKTPRGEEREIVEKELF